jgi:hypothetical protein
VRQRWQRQTVAVFPRKSPYYSTSPPPQRAPLLQAQVALRC